MALQRIDLTLTELRCLAQSEGSGGSEPYLWTTFFAFGGERLPHQTGNLAMVTPAYDAFRVEFPNGVTSGEAVPVPAFVASAHFDMDLETAPKPKLVGCVAVLMEEDSTPQSSIVLGRIAYAKEIQAQLEALVSERIRTANYGDITNAEIEAIKSAVKAKVEEAVMSNQHFWDLPWQDDNIGFTYALFKYPRVDENDDDPTIEFQFFDLPEIANGSDRFALTGRLSIEALPPDVIDLCAPQRAALRAKEEELAGLQSRRAMLQTMLQNATPQQKAAIVDAIEATNALMGQVEAEIPDLQTALEECLPIDVGGQVVVEGNVVVNPGG
jgi:hypothetical protein